MRDAAADLPGLLVCQETLAPLEPTPDGLWSAAAQRLYPTRGGLVYMGFPERDAAMIAATMQEEHGGRARRARSSATRPSCAGARRGRSSSSTSSAAT